MTSTKATKLFPIIKFISDLPNGWIPQLLSPFPENGTATGRLVIIGDVHGMRKSLEALLEKVDFDKRKGDHLILVGDLVNKGPDSPGVVDLAIKLGASAVRGNHENAVLNAAAEIRATKDVQQNPENVPGTSPAPEISEASTRLPGSTARDPEIPEKKHSSATYSTASALSQHHLDWLAALPLILRIKLPHNLSSPYGDTLVVTHAGLVPGIPLEEQDPYSIMHMRSLERAPGDVSGFTPAEASGEEGWVTEWDRWQDGLQSKTTVVFGHDAKRRLQLGRYTIGLDSACLYGNQLSAIVIEASEGKIGHRIVQVECADEPVAPNIPKKEGGETVVV
ncbi:Metallo-dependent phosphatase [Penicillium verhagenii]|uniref:Metallo-dependent phosphatase n=1 Tax=Penicillium verhagenii TaxID=1562060 RepID=UPI002544D83D|nr:Metallo-dependent phosphatase [Penicillium verhagenii]KAJ5938966.1 Metallo-dependent phosphatase [Penicillium verhagenii]